ncbi:hypothetical protein JI739_03795 [Ramlibacter sp. AW1]|uniref:Uncharacterized protein n=1 Tax=Ramlibacter aurantiacus TaxID=2801330 RepID=A0A937D271_9BURK|nr:hypothetical protein [Ramlibacter aurantiacus]MBL0419465.1 hypothetical protein [Ramlibacter aurantiacus]
MNLLRQGVREEAAAWAVANKTGGPVLRPASYFIQALPRAEPKAANPA